MPAERNATSVACTVCDKFISRKADLPRHMRTHAEDKEALMHACPFPDCDHKTLQKSNMLTHIRTHTREFSKTCPHPGCAFATTDPGSLTRHRKVLHGYEPKARCSPGGKAARRSAAAPYPSTQFMKPEAEIPASLDLNEPAFPELAGLVRCDALSPAESSGSAIPQISGELDELPWERLFPDLPVEAFTSLYDQPSQLPVPTSNYYQPPTVPAGPSTLNMPQFDPELSSNVNYQQPISDVPDMPAELDEFLQKYGSGFFEGRCEYPDSATYSMAQPSFTNEHNAD